MKVLRMFRRSKKDPSDPLWFRGNTGARRFSMEPLESRLLLTANARGDFTDTQLAQGPVHFIDSEVVRAAEVSRDIAITRVTSNSTVMPAAEDGVFNLNASLEEMSLREFDIATPDVSHPLILKGIAGDKTSIFGKGAFSNAVHPLQTSIGKISAFSTIARNLEISGISVAFAAIQRSDVPSGVRGINVKGVFSEPPLSIDALPFDLPVARKTMDSRIDVQGMTREPRFGDSSFDVQTGGLGNNDSGPASKPHSMSVWIAMDAVWNQAENSTLTHSLDEYESEEIDIQKPSALGDREAILLTADDLSTTEALSQSPSDAATGESVGSTPLAMDMEFSSQRSEGGSFFDESQAGISGGVEITSENNSSSENESGEVIYDSTTVVVAGTMLAASFGSPLSRLALPLSEDSTESQRTAKRESRSTERSRKERQKRYFWTRGTNVSNPAQENIVYVATEQHELPSKGVSTTVAAPIIRGSTLSWVVSVACGSALVRQLGLPLLQRLRGHEMKVKKVATNGDVAFAETVARSARKTKAM